MDVRACPPVVQRVHTHVGFRSSEGLWSEPHVLEQLELYVRRAPVPQHVLHIVDHVLPGRPQHVQLAHAFSNAVRDYPLAVRQLPDLAQRVPYSPGHDLLGSGDGPDDGYAQECLLQVPDCVQVQNPVRDHLC